MTTHRGDHDRRSDPLAGMAAPQAPADLKATILRAARAAAGRQTPRDFWTRLWENRTARVAWALSLASLVLANVGLSLRDSPRVRTAAGPGSAATEQELAEIVDLPRLRLDLGARSLGRSEPAGDSDDSAQDKERS